MHLLETQIVGLIQSSKRRESVERNTLKLPKNEYYVLSGASLVLRGIREICSDIDLCISKELFSDVKDRLKMTPDKLNSCNFYQLSDALEMVVDKKDHFNMEEGDEFNLEIYKREFNVVKRKSKLIWTKSNGFIG